MKSYHVTFLVSATKLPTLLQAVTPDVSLVKVEEAPASIAATAIPKRMGYVGGRRNKGISAEALVLQTLSPEPKRTWSSIELGEVFVSHGFAAHSFTAAASKLVAEGKIRRVAPGLFAPLGLTVHRSAS